MRLAPPAGRRACHGHMLVTLMAHTSPQLPDSTSRPVPSRSFHLPTRPAPLSLLPSADSTRFPLAPSICRHRPGANTSAGRWTACPPLWQSAMLSCCGRAPLSLGGFRHCWGSCLAGAAGWRLPLKRWVFADGWAACVACKACGAGRASGAAGRL